MLMNGKEVNSLIINGEIFDKRFVGKTIELNADTKMYFRTSGAAEKPKNYTELYDWGTSAFVQNCKIVEVIESADYVDLNSKEIKGTFGKCFLLDKVSIKHPWIDEYTNQGFIVFKDGGFKFLD